MSTIGHTINGGLVFVIFVAMVGTAGATLYFQHSVDQLDERAEALSNQTETLERNLTATRAELRAERERARELDESLDVSKADVSTLSTRLKRADERHDAAKAALVERERRLESTESELADAEAELADAESDLRAVCEVLDESDATAAAGETTTADSLGGREWTDRYWEYELWADEEWDYENHEGGADDPWEDDSWHGEPDDDYGGGGDVPAACAPYV